MSEKEKKAIQLLKSYAGMTHKLTDNQGRPKLDQAIETALNYIEQLEKEIEELETYIDQLENEYVDEDYGIDFRPQTHKERTEWIKKNWR